MKNILISSMRIALLFVALLSAYVSHGQITPVGSGSYTNSFPGVDVAGRNGFPSGLPGLSGIAATKPVPTNDWWSDLIKRDHGGKAFNYPLSFKSKPTGIVVNYTIPLASRPNEYREPISAVDAIVIGVDGLSAAESTASDHSDWSVTMNWDDRFNATMLIGSPFVYFEKNNAGDLAKVDVSFNPSGVSIDGNKLIITNNMNNANYVVFAPSGATWTNNNGSYTSTLNGKDYWSMAMLPPGTDVSTAIASYESYAYVFPASTTADWNYNEFAGALKTTFTVTTDVKEGTESTFLQGLLPHQWDRLAAESPQPAGPEYPSVRGTIKTLASNTFTVENTFSGILPTLPELGRYSNTYNPGELASKISQIKNDGLAEFTDSYNEGQSMNRLVQTARIADQLGDIESRDALLNTVQARLEDWLTAESGEVSFLFYYNSDWDALIGYPAGHRQDVNLNDHHFHWGYFIHAAAAIEQFRPGWANQWGEMVNLLVKDAANPSRTDDMFPFLRNFSPYAGHSWANGFATEPLGNDQESTSESMQFNSALIHWGTLTGNQEIRDLGVYLYTTELSTIQEYWFDVEQRSFQPEYAYQMVARLWASGYDNGTWWTQDVAASYGIQLYPIHGGSLYLGHRRDYVDRVWTEMTQNTAVLNNIANDNLWYDTYWKFLSFTDPDQALAMYQSYTNRNLKFGVSDAQTYHWLHNMVAMGQVQNNITADYPIAAVFEKAGSKTYVVHNYGTTSRVVNFSDGFSLTAPPQRITTNRDSNIEVTVSSSQEQIANGGSVNLNALVTGTGVTSVEFYADDALLGVDNSAPYSINSGSLNAGFVSIYARAYSGDEQELSNVINVQVGDQLPYTGTPANIPGTIEAANYDVFEGGFGQGVTYSDNNAFNEGTFRPEEAVDASISANEGATVGWTGGGEWLEYTVNVAQPGKYNVSVRYASGNGAGGGPFWFEKNGSRISPETTVNSTGDWGAWQTIVVEDVNLLAGEQVIRLAFGNGGFNIGRMTFEYIGVSDIPVLTQIRILPETVQLTTGETLQFTATGLDQFGNEIAVSPSWSATSGSISSTGEYQATTSGPVVVTALAEGISSEVSFSVAANNQPILTSLIIDPRVSSIYLNETIQFTVLTLDQFGDEISTDLSWSSNIGSVNQQGSFTGTTPGIATVTASAGGLSVDATVSVVDNSPVYCTGGPENGDYTYAVSGDSSNPTITFTPGRSGVGANIVILYYGTKPDGGYPGYVVQPGEAYQVSANGGQTVYFYYTYSVPEGGERNTAANMHSFETGNCSQVSPIPMLSTMTLTPETTTVELNQNVLFSVLGFDQFGNPFSVNPTWSANGGTISNSGDFSSSVAGTFVITAIDGNISATASVTVNAAATSNCTINAANGDYSTEISGSASNPTMKFIPGRPGVGNGIVILYYGTNPDGAYPGYIVQPEEAYQINANAGQTVYFYYTYSVPEGGERNTFQSKESFVVGACQQSTAGRQESQMDDSFFDAISVLRKGLNIFPNPVKGVLNINLDSEAISSVKILTITGQVRREELGENGSHSIAVSVTDLAAGTYLIVLRTIDDQVIFDRFIKE
ncbi:MAG: glycosyl hydrolase [Bacteroidota bacterium]